VATIDAGLRDALDSVDASVRLQAALSAGTYPDPGFVDALIERCAIEPDFQVREMLTWALVRHPAALTVPLLLREVRGERAQARSQALHTLSKVGDPLGWAAITPALLHDADDDVARTAWRAAVILVPRADRAVLAVELVGELGRGDRDLRRSLARAVAELGDDARDALASVATHADREVRVQAAAIGRLIDDPDEAFETAVFEAERTAT
jgi:HEAT repeat protein